MTNRSTRRKRSVKTSLLFIFLVFASCTTHNLDPVPDTNRPVVIADEMPQFPGGNQGLQQWLVQNLHYPSGAAERGIQGRVYVKFIVDTEGQVTQAQVIRGVTPSLDREALRVVQQMPRWKPATHNGKAVSISYILPVKFTLQ